VIHNIVRDDAEAIDLLDREKVNPVRAEGPSGRVAGNEDVETVNGQGRR
jgi:hypothetical protein